MGINCGSAALQSIKREHEVGAKLLDLKQYLDTGFFPARPLPD